jgi:hypothetical protein
MSSLIIPALALGGVYLIYSGLTKKDKKNSSSSSDSINTKRSSRKNSNIKKRSTSSLSNIKIKNKKTLKNKDNSKQRTIYVYYSNGSNKNKKWSYKSLPEGWSLKNKANLTNFKYSKLNTFNGPKLNREDIKKYLEKAYEYLKKKNIIKSYKISYEKLN